MRRVETKSDENKREWTTRRRQEHDALIRSASLLLDRGEEPLDAIQTGELDSMENGESLLLVVEAECSTGRAQLARSEGADETPVGVEGEAICC